MNPALHGVVARILAARDRAASGRSVLVAMTGIDGAGKGYLSARLVEALQGQGVRVAAITIDGWLNLPARRFATANPAEHFYRHAIRFDEMFGTLALPLRDRRSLRLEADLVEETATAYHRHTYDFADIDVIVLEGIYLLERAFQGLYDLSFWVDCSFATALGRALARRQEGLTAEDTIVAYRTLYFPAQAIHIAQDAPRSAATAIVNNDPRWAGLPVTAQAWSAAETLRAWQALGVARES